MLYWEIGGRIRELREIQGYTREGFAEKIDVSVKHMYEIECGIKGFSAHILGRMSKALCVSCDYIMFGEEKEFRGREKLIHILENLDPKQIRNIQDILRILNTMCDAL